MNTLTLIIPGLLPKLDTAIEEIESFSGPSLAYFLSRSKENFTAPGTFVETLFQAFQAKFEHELPAAAVGALSEDLDGAHPYWLRADPVELHADHAGIYMLGNLHLELQDIEIKEYIHELNEIFNKYDYHLYAPKWNEWYLNVAADPKIHSAEILDVIGKDISKYLPTGANKQHWQTLLTETQMLLHTLPVSVNRGKQQLASVSSLWFWGGGKLPELKHKVFTCIWTDEAIAKGLARLSEVPSYDSSGAAECINYLEATGNYLVVLSEAYNHLVHGDIKAWREYIEQIEYKWFTPLLSALKTGQLKQVIIETCDGRRFVMDKGRLKHWWRRIRNFQYFLPTDSLFANE